MFKDKTGIYFEIEELYHAMPHAKQKTLSEFREVIEGLVEKGYIDFVKNKGYHLSTFGRKENKRWKKEEIEKWK